MTLKKRLPSPWLRDTWWRIRASRVSNRNPKDTKHNQRTAKLFTITLLYRQSYLICFWSFSNICVWIAQPSFNFDFAAILFKFQGLLCDDIIKQLNSIIFTSKMRSSFARSVVDKKQVNGSDNMILWLNVFNQWFIKLLLDWMVYHLVRNCLLDFFTNCYAVY